MIVEELYDALIEAGASDTKARAASRAIADMETHFAKLREDISRVDQKIERLELKVDGTFRLHNWMLGTILAFVIALFFKQF
jgi:predicted  nucleic acid-binding Zn-ribbon protein